MSTRDVVVVVGNPQVASRTATAARLLAERIGAMAGASGPTVIDLADHARRLVEWNDPVVTGLKATVLDAAALVVASPTYKASYTGLVKLFLERFDAGELHGLPTVALMTGGSTTHALAVDVHLTPVLLEIGASCPARGLFLAGTDVDEPVPAIERWLEHATPAWTRALR